MGSLLSQNKKIQSLDHWSCNLPFQKIHLQLKQYFDFTFIIFKLFHFDFMFIKSPTRYSRLNSTFNASFHPLKQESFSHILIFFIWYEVSLFHLNINLLVFGDFLRAGEFYEPNSTSLDASGFTPSDTPLTALSAISISTEQRTPIPGTGQQITTLFTPANSGEQFPLQQFFDYNKDYLSFPLTNDIETLFVVASQSSVYDGSAATTLTAALTWEEQ